MGDLHHSVGRRTILKAGVAWSGVQIASPLQLSLRLASSL
jgi:hypothetical protein